MTFFTVELIKESILKFWLGRTVLEELAPKLWVRLCLLRSQFLRKTFPQVEQLYGLISVWVNRCVFRLDRWLKDLLQTGHLCGDSSMCRILWTAKVRDWQKPLPHSVHLKGFSLLWMYLKQIKFYCIIHKNNKEKKIKLVSVLDTLPSSDLWKKYRLRSYDGKVWLKLF